MICKSLLLLGNGIMLMLLLSGPPAMGKHRNTSLERAVMSSSLILEAILYQES